MKYNYTLINHTHNRLELAMDLTKDMDFFDGHFKGNKIMPAVAQLYLVEKFSRELFKLKGLFQSMRQVKFLAPICPDTTVHINIEYRPDLSQICFEFLEKNTVKSKGKLNYSEANSCE